MNAPAELLQATELAPSLKILLVLTILGLLPAILLTTTSFVRTVVVLSFVRQGVGAGQSPPTQVIMGLAMFLTMFTMSPVVDQIKTTAVDPYQAGKISDIQALEAGSLPLKRFMLRQTREADLKLFYNATNAPLPQTPDDVPMRLCMPAFVISELTTAFQMGVVILLPFLVVDLAVASLLMSMGMMMVPPSTIALPIKLLLFVLVDGWNLVAGSLLPELRVTTDGAVELFRNAIMITALIAGPPLLAALLVGLIVGVLQAATQVNEASISFVSKLIAVGLTFAVLGSWTVRQLVDYTGRTIASISDVTR